MNETRNSKSLMESLGEAEAKIRALFMEKPLAWWREAHEKMQDIPKANFDLGVQFAQQGLWGDAALRFRMALWFKADYPQAWAKLGECYYRTGAFAKAAAALQKALAREPTNVELLAQLASINEAVAAQHHS